MGRENAQEGGQRGLQHIRRLKNLREAEDLKHNVLFAHKNAAIVDLIAQLGDAGAEALAPDGALRKELLVVDELVCFLVLLGVHVPAGIAPRAAGGPIGSCGGRGGRVGGGGGTSRSSVNPLRSVARPPLAVLLLFRLSLHLIPISVLLELRAQNPRDGRHVTLNLIKWVRSVVGQPAPVADLRLVRIAVVVALQLDDALNFISAVGANDVAGERGDLLWGDGGDDWGPPPGLGRLCDAVGAGAARPCAAPRGVAHVVLAATSTSALRRWCQWPGGGAAKLHVLDGVVVQRQETLFRLRIHFYLFIFVE